MDRRAGGPASGVATGDGALWGEYGRRIAFLRRVGIFYDASPLLLAHIAAALRPIRAEAGKIICRQGEVGELFYLIDEGTLAVTIEAGNRQNELGRLGPGEFFGEMALLRTDSHADGRRYTATVRAISAAQLWGLGADDFRELLAREPGIAAIVQRAANLREATNASSAFEVENRNLAILAQGRQRLTLGRDQTSDLSFPSRLVSRNHAVVESDGATFVIRDLDSSNGTFVNGQRVTQAALQDGDEIWLADERFVFDRRQISRPPEKRGIRVDVRGLTKTVRGGKAILNDVSLSIASGEFVAIVGGSGAGKTTLMDAISGVRPATGGSVLYNGRDYYASMALYRNVLGYVPQDDIIHTALPVRDTLHYAAQLRLPPDTSRADLDAAVDQTLEELGMTAQAKTIVASLSGGQRKRCSIGVELLTRPRIFFLDEPTSGLDPATDAQMMRLMRGLANDGSTVLLTTHATKNVMLCDKIIFLARGGFLAFVGTPQQALQYFAAEAFDEIYERLGNEATPEAWADRFRNSPTYAQILAEQPQSGANIEAGQHAPLGASGNKGGLLKQIRQFSVLTRRAARIITASRAQLMPLIMQPIALSILILILFSAGGFDLDAENPAASVPLLFLLAFAALLFGIFDGIQEIVKEAAIFQRERMINLAIIPYVLSKIAVFAPHLIFCKLVMVTILLIFGRLPDFSVAIYGSLIITLLLTTFTAFMLGLCGSAAISTTSQASQIMPVLIMPQAIFAGAILAVPAMGVVGRAISTVFFMRWSFEGLGRSVDLNNLFTNGSAPSAQGAAAIYGDSFSRAVGQDWLFLAGFMALYFVLTCVILWRKSART